jgi:pyruvate/2-oxoglutarate dehydrogenase complex dihydrolipoamide dehydrogenase (E3) component
MVAAGAAPVMPEIPGADGRNVRAPIFVYGNEKALGKHVVVVGGQQIAVETGIYLAGSGHKVTLLAAERRLAEDANEIHFVSMLRKTYEALDNFSYITGATVTEIASGRVTYNAAGKGEKTIGADDVVIYAGRQPRRDDAMKFFGTAKRFFMIGDCNIHGILKNHIDGNVATAMRSAFAAASQI